MKNRFYSDEDIEPLEARGSQDYRTPFQIDRDRIVHTASFRRLQGKTQVFWPGEYDFYRTRLTHSLEVAQIGKAIANHLNYTTPVLDDSNHIDGDLMEAICLSHDLGHPPFGHCGERALNEVMSEWGGFEGNAQTLRLLTETIYDRTGARHGMKPTRAFADGVMKYKLLRSERLDKDAASPKNHFLYDDQKSVRDFVHRDHFDGGGASNDRFEKSLECQIMDWADDTAYSIHDISDGIRAGFLTSKSIEKWASNQQLTEGSSQGITDWLRAIHDEKLASHAALKIGEFIKSTTLRERTNSPSDSNRYAWRVEITKEASDECGSFVALARDLVYESARVHQMEYKGRRLIIKIFEVLASSYLEQESPRWHLLPTGAETLLSRSKDQSERARRLCDYVAGMTDAFAIRTYKRLFDPDFGSIVDFV